MSLELGAGGIDLERRPVRTRLDHRAIGVADRDDAGADRDRVPPQAVRIAAAVPALVARADDRHDPGESLDRGEDPLADDRVSPHQLPLLVVERRGLVEDRLGDPDLADVVEQRSELDRLEEVVAEAEPARHLDGEVRDLLRVHARVAVLRLERARERGQRLAVQPLHRLRVLELREQDLEMADEELRERGVGAVEGALPRVVHLDEAPRAPADV